jgi:TPR repeat protein
LKFEKGDGAEKDLDTAIYWYEKSAKQLNKISKSSK